MFNDYAMAEEDIEEFRALIPDYCVGPLKDGSLHGLVVINPDSLSAPAVGIVLFRLAKGFIEVEWVAPTKDYDLPDYGADMVRRLLNKARVMRGVLGVRGRFRKGDRMSEFFPENEFSRSREPGGVYRFPLSDVANLKGDNKRDENCVSLGAADGLLKNSVLDCFSRSEQALPVSRPVKWDSYEQDLSFIFRGAKDAEGIVLVKKEEEELVLSLLYSENPVAAMTLLNRAFNAAKEKYGEAYTVACPVLNAVTEGLVKKIVRNPGREELIRAEARIPAGTGTLGDFVYFSSVNKDDQRD
ncbi:MAG: hypothetical protein K5985_07455 [Lachnospiraceae bacterium]|nr:hypothetical protein [Lachnospiraceae bacterium]